MRFEIKPIGEYFGLLKVLSGMESQGQKENHAMPARAGVLDADCGLAREVKFRDFADEAEHDPLANASICLHLTYDFLPHGWSGLEIVHGRNVEMWIWQTMRAGGGIPSKNIHAVHG
jgi:hypothetical protein